MKLALSSKISKIDAFCAEKLGISTESLMKKSGIAVAKVIKRKLSRGKNVVILAGKGNNGGDGYAAACELSEDYSVTVYDIFGEGQKNDAGLSFYNQFLALGGKIEKYDASPKTLSAIKNADAIIDAIFGTGFKGEVPEELRSLAIAIRESVSAYKLAVDVPLGIGADDGSAGDFAISVDATVELCIIKPGIISYPARSYVGEVIYDSLDIPLDVIYENFDFRYEMINEASLKELLPKREANSNKGSFGKLLMITGSEKFKGAAHLSLEAALRGGVGYVNYLGCGELVGELSQKFPEAIYKSVPCIEDITKEEINEITELSKKCSATLIGSGSDNTKGLLDLTLSLLSIEGSPLVLDADAINALSGLKEEGRAALKSAKRPVVITPHPLEFARLFGCDVGEVQSKRMELAERFAKEYGVFLVLKGAGTVIADSEKLSINATGSSALAKAGSGDVLAGLLAALLAQKIEPHRAACLAVSLHALSGDRLAKEYSSYGVTPSDLPREIARVIAAIENA